MGDGRVESQGDFARNSRDVKDSMDRANLDLLIRVLQSARERKRMYFEPMEPDSVIH
jgi:hypothetical protein